MQAPMHRRLAEARPGGALADAEPVAPVELEQLDLLEGDDQPVRS